MATERDLSTINKEELDELVDFLEANDKFDMIIQYLQDIPDDVFEEVREAVRQSKELNDDNNR